MARPKGIPAWNKKPETLLTRMCQYCNKMFFWKATPSRLKKGWGKYCSRSCHLKERNKIIKPSDALKGKIAWNNRQKTVTCDTCKKKFLCSPSARNYKRKFCSRKCQGIKAKSWGAGRNFCMGSTPWNKGRAMLNIRGKSHPNWKGGITSLGSKIRQSIEYKLWRRSIFMADNYTCQTCRLRGGIKLNVDHYPFSFSQILVAFDIKNMENALNCDLLWNINNGRTLCEPCHKETSNYLYKSNQKIKNV